MKPQLALDPSDSMSQLLRIVILVTKEGLYVRYIWKRKKEVSDYMSYTGEE